MKDWLKEPPSGEWTDWALMFGCAVGLVLFFMYVPDIARWVVSQ